MIIQNKRAIHDFGRAAMGKNQKQNEMDKSESTQSLDRWDCPWWPGLCKAFPEEPAARQWAIVLNHCDRYIEEKDASKKEKEPRMSIGN